MLKVTTAEQFHELTGSEGLTVAVYKADWCGDCKFIDPFMPEVEQEYASRLKLIQVDVDELEEISREQNILGIPSFIAYSGGKELIRFVNKLRKSRTEIEDFLNKAVAVHETLKAQA
ncbi:thioredoxin family protein [Paenibacillus physcomitrellae]|uniref:Thiol reductase thioredoxin n=1 Tax=Paenibacillus physcomitrellae TaxID=1619311 RepID=A0ABQ1G0V1_9BACL|nr:thioredoxin family protein [Paenibacillus physcomitrellae]GGA35238.1 thiol reductase thioredoxin [Paenibacillus physcomitrellae]